jgi:hypothetical protein
MYRSRREGLPRVKVRAEGRMDKEICGKTAQMDGLRWKNKATPDETAVFTGWRGRFPSFGGGYDLVISIISYHICTILASMYTHS